MIVKRDDSLDLLKGAACIMMILSHAAIETTNPILLGMGYFGSFAAVLFFSVTGATAWLQTSRRSLREILPSYLILFLAGFSLNGMIQINFYQHFKVEILQIIALGAFLVFVLQSSLHLRPVHFLIAGIMIYFIKFMIDLFGKNSIVIMHNDWFVGIQGIIIPPGTFTPIPWLFVFFFGAFAYQVSVRINLYLSYLSFFTALVILFLANDPVLIDLFNRWDMSPVYFLFSSFVLFFSFSLIKKIPISPENILIRLLLFLGRNSLLFLYVHIFVIRVLFNLGVARFIWIYWLLVLTLSCLLLSSLLYLYPRTGLASLFSKKVSWSILTICVLTTPVFFRNILTIFLLEFFWGVCLSLNYRLLRDQYRDRLNLVVSVHT